jgi:hypothetical protein
MMGGEPAEKGAKEIEKKMEGKGSTAIQKSDLLRIERLSR